METNSLRWWMRMNKSGSHCVSSISVMYFLFQISSRWTSCVALDTIHHRDNHVHHLQLLLKFIIIRRNAAGCVARPVILCLCEKSREQEIEMWWVLMHISTSCMHQSYFLAYFLSFISSMEMHSLEPGVALCITLACFRAALNGRHNCNEKEQPWLQMPHLLLQAGLEWGFTNTAIQSLNTALSMLKRAANISTYVE